MYGVHIESDVPVARCVQVGGLFLAKELNTLLFIMSVFGTVS